MAEPKEEVKAVEMMAEVRQVRTLADGSVNIVLNVGEESLKQAQFFLGSINDLVRVIAVKEGAGDA